MKRRSSIRALGSPRRVTDRERPAPLRSPRPPPRSLPPARPTVRLFLPPRFTRVSPPAQLRRRFEWIRSSFALSRSVSCLFPSATSNPLQFCSHRRFCVRALCTPLDPTRQTSVILAKADSPLLRAARALAKSGSMRAGRA